MLESVSSKIPLSLTTQALLLGATVGLITYQLFKKKYKLPPGPWAPPLIGNMASMRSLPFYKRLIIWKKTYGPIMLVYLGPFPCVVLNTPDVVNEALVKKGADFAGRMKAYSMEVLTSGYKDIAFADISPEWKMLRKIALQGLRQYLSGNKLQERLFESTMQAVKVLKEKEGEEIDVEKYISYVVFDLLYGVCFSKRFEMEDKQFNRLRECLDVGNAEGGDGVWEDIIPLLRYYPTKRFTRMVTEFKYFVDFVREECKTHNENFSEDNLTDFTDFMINAKKQAVLEDPNVENLITEEHLVQTGTDIFAAGVDTTRQTITWTIFLLVKHPDIQKKAQAEIDKVLDIGQMPTLADREQLPYTEAVLHESMRICPVAPVGLPHATICDTTLREYELPKNTMVMINHYALHMDPEVWGDPEVFRPERLLDEDGTLAPKTMSWLPFSAGRRNCLGESIARPEMHLMMALLLRNFTFSCAEGKELDLTPGGSMAMIPPKNALVVKSR